MEKKERELFKALCSFKDEDFDVKLLKFASPAVLGQLFFNRMQAVAYGVLKKHDLLGEVNREFRNSLKVAYEHNIKKNQEFFQCVNYIGEIMSKCSCNYAMLKGAYLCKTYPEGYRTSNDIDLLVHSNDVTKVGNALINAGFKQGSIKNGIFIPATRREIIESKMLRGETVPYIKQIELDGMKFLEVDINFSLDYKFGDTYILENMLKNASLLEVNGLEIRTLKYEDFFVHLCSHLYKEATTLPWVEMMRDMTLYKYLDIYMFLYEKDNDEIDLLFENADKTDTLKICAFAVAQMSELFNFPNKYATEKAGEILKNEPEFLHTVISPKDKSTYLFTEKSVEARFFSNARKKLLKKVD